MKRIKVTILPNLESKWQQQYFSEINKYLEPKTELIKSAKFTIEKKKMKIEDKGFVHFQFKLKNNKGDRFLTASFILPENSPIRFTQEDVDILSEGIVKRYWEEISD